MSRGFPDLRYTSTHFGPWEQAGRRPTKISFLLPLVHCSEGWVWAFSRSHVSHPRESCPTRAFMDSHPLPCAQMQTQSQCRQTHAPIHNCHPRKAPCPRRATGGSWLPELQAPSDVQDMSFQMSDYTLGSLRGTKIKHMIE